MDLQLATAPTSWGVEDPTDELNPAWQTVLTQVADAGFAGTELGPLGYMPTDPEVLRAELEDRGLRLVGGYVFEPLYTRDGARAALDAARRTAQLIGAAGGELLVIIPGFTPERERAAGRPDEAQPLTDEEWRIMVGAIHDIAGIAADEHGLTAVVHPHAGTPVEYEDEIERLAELSEVALCLDTGHCAYAGGDPVALYEKLAKSVAYFHFKDVDPERLARVLDARLSFEQAVRQRVFCPLGAGTVDFAALRDALEQHDFSGWATVEQDRLPTDSTTPAQDAAASLTHLREVGLA
jgi:inosose dehydratase